MRIVFVDLHINGFFVKDLGRMISRRRAICKHRFLLDSLVKAHIPVINLITLGGSALPSPTLRAHTRYYWLRKWEAKFVLAKNGFSAREISCITDPSLIQPTDCVIYYSTFRESQYENILQVHGHKIVDHIHFYGDKEKAEMLKDRGIQYYMYEVDLQKYCKLYQKNYAWFQGRYIVRPYAFETRFRVLRQYSERKKKAVAMGTLTRCDMPEFIEAYGTTCYQPHRKMIMDNAAQYPDELDSFISEYNETPLKVVNEQDFAVVKLYKKMGNFFHSGRQKSYFSFDMVEKYNEYQMFICPEDINGSYGVGTLEGMACGCAMIGWDYGAFEDMGMVAGVHYIPYDGTMEGLIKQIRQYQKPEMQAELEKIARTGCEYVRQHFSEEAVAREYYENLKRVCDKG